MLQRINRLLGSRNVLLLAIVYSCGIIVLFLIPTSDLPSIKVSGTDKAVHAIIFFVLLMIWQLYVFRYRDNQLLWKDILWLLSGSLFFGIIIEVLQGALTASRTADPYDVLADFVGSVLAVYIFQKLKPVFRV